MTRARLAAVLCGLVLAISATGIARAADLSLTAPTRATTDVVERCADTTIALAGASGSGDVTVAEIPAACGGLPLTVWLHDRGATYQEAAIAPQGGGQLTVAAAGLALGADTAALVTVDSWPMPTSLDVADPPDLPFLTCTTPDDPAVGCTASVSGAFQWQHDGVKYWNRHLAISTTSDSLVRWEIVINLSAADLPFQPTRHLSDLEGGLVKVAASRCEVEPRTVTVQGTTGWGPYNLVSSSQPRRSVIEGRSTAQGGSLLNCP